MSAKFTLKKNGIFFKPLILGFSILAFFSACAPLKANIEKSSNENSPENRQTITPTSSMAKTPKTGDTIATLITDKGEIKILLYDSQSPETVKNFIELAKNKKYDGTPFHRVINDFMIQTGDFERGDGRGGYSYKGPGTYLQDEFSDGLEHIRGAVSMANAGPNTGGSQFFIVQAEGGTPWLNGYHSIFGYVFEGMDVVDKIAEVDVDSADRPLEPIKIKSVAISQQ